MEKTKFVLADKKFIHGPIVNVHEIGGYKIAEYYPFHCDTRSYDTLDQALIGAICKKYDGDDTRADHYIFSMLKMD